MSRTISSSAFRFIEPEIGFDLRAISFLVPDSTLTTLDLWDTNLSNGFNTGQFNVETGQFFPPISGVYHTRAVVVFDANSTGERLAQICLNSNPIYSVQVPANAVGDTFITISGGTPFLRPNDVLTLQVSQNSGGVLATTTDTTWSLFLQRKTV